MRKEKRKTIVIASILKPVDDSRMFEKIAVSLAAANKYKVHVIGFPSKATPPHNKIDIHPLPRFKRLSVQRLFARVLVLRKLFALRPSLVIVTTHELLGVGIAARIYLRAKLIYDVQENYFRNLLYGKTMPKFLAVLAASLVRLKEIVTSPFVSHFILAEKCFVEELNFVGRKFSIAENKSRRPDGIQREKAAPIRLLFSGTLAESTGVLDAIGLATQLYHHNKSVSLTIIGHCALESFNKKLMEAVAGKPFITIIGGRDLVPHLQIIEAIKAADFGLVLYRPNAATEQRIPTKLYEYFAYRLPVIAVNHRPWRDLVTEYQAGIVLGKEIDPGALLSQMEAMDFYGRETKGCYWEDEEQRLTDVVAKLIK